MAGPEDFLCPFSPYDPPRPACHFHSSRLFLFRACQTRASSARRQCTFTIAQAAIEHCKFDVLAHLSSTNEHASIIPLKRTNYRGAIVGSSGTRHSTVVISALDSRSSSLVRDVPGDTSFHAAVSAKLGSSFPPSDSREPGRPGDAIRDPQNATAEGPKLMGSCVRGACLAGGYTQIVMLQDNLVPDWDTVNLLTGLDRCSSTRACHLRYSADASSEWRNGQDDRE